jgi:histidine triad (HIT) family protein
LDCGSSFLKSLVQLEIIHDKVRKMDCIICQLVNEEIEVTKVYEDDLVVAVMDIRPINPGHLFISPKKHVELVSELDAESGAHIFKIAMKLADTLRRSGLKCEGVNFLLADGEVAGQEIPHVHLHVIPRIRGDGFGLRFGKSYLELPERKELEQAANSIRIAIE